MIFDRKKTPKIQPEEAVEKADEIIEEKKASPNQFSIDIAETKMLKDLDEKSKRLIGILGALEYEHKVSTSQILNQINLNNQEFAKTMTVIRKKYKISENDKITNIDYEKNEISLNSINPFNLKK